MKRTYAILLLISAAMLIFQVTLTRLFSLGQGSHLAFMAVSLALLGAGAGGTYLSLRRVAASRLARLLTGGSLLFALSVPAAYLAINYLPFDAYRIAWERIQLGWLALYYLALTVPFFFSGLVIGAALAVYPEQAGPIYAANLIGSALGPPLALFSLAWLGGPGTIFLCVLLGWLAVMISRWPGRGDLYRRSPYLVMAIALIYLMIQPPPFFAVRLSPYKALSQARLYPGSEIVFSEWNAFSRVDVLRSEGVRSAPGLSFTYPGRLPPQLGLTVDGDNLTPISGSAVPTFTHYLPLNLGFRLRPEAKTLILEPGGGLAVLTALQGEAASVTVVHSNPTVVEAIRDEFAAFNDHLYHEPRLAVVVEEPRSFLRRTGQQFDLILMPLTDSFRPVTAGAYTLNEDYRYTVEALADMMAHLKPDGLLLIERWLQLPPTESLRLWGTAIEAVRSRQVTDPAAHLWAVRTLQTSLVGISAAPLEPAEIEGIRQFAGELQFDLVWLPGLQPEAANRYSIVPEATYYDTFTTLLNTDRPAAFWADYPFAVAPPTDNHPYFFHFFKWRQTPEILQTLGKTWQPFGGSGYLVLVVLLILVVIFSTGLIALPLFWLDTEAAAPPWARLRYLLYFALLGLGFLFVEIPLLQRFILYLGQPAYAFAIVVAALLMATGLGSNFLSGRLSLRLALPLIVGLTLLYPWLLPHLFNATLSLPFAGRIVITVAALFPLGLVLGVPFPRGLIQVGRVAPHLTPWVWAVNGCASVVSAVLAAMIALTWGFSAVLWSAALAYSLAALTMWRG